MAHQASLDPTRVHSLSPAEFKSKFKEGTFAPNPYKDIERRAAATVGINHDGIYEHNMLSPADQLILSQVNLWERNFPQDISDLPSYVDKTMTALRTKYTKAFYFWTAYNKAKDNLNLIAVGNDLIDKQSPVIQANGSCPGARGAYVQCTDVFHTIDTVGKEGVPKLTLPLDHKVTCFEPFLALEQCVEFHLKNWSKAMKVINKLEKRPEYQQYYLDIERQINGRDYVTVIDETQSDSDKALNLHLSLYRYDPEIVTKRDIQVAEALFEIKRKHPQEYFERMDYYEAMRRPTTPQQSEETRRTARLYNIDYSSLHLELMLTNLDRAKAQARYEDQWGKLKGWVLVIIISMIRFLWGRWDDVWEWSGRGGEHCQPRRIWAE